MEEVDMAKKGEIIQNEDKITITQIDYLRLKKLIQTLSGSRDIDPVYLSFLNIELQKAVKIDSRLITPDFVTMDSLITVCFIDSGKKMDLSLVYPESANFSKGLISVLSPLGCALLGYKAGDIVVFKAPKGEQKVRIEEVLYQPEAHGEDLP